MIKGLFVVAATAALVYVGSIIGHKGQEAIKAQECKSAVQFMNLYTDGTPEYKKYADKFFELGCTEWQ